jgi:hypothetical protein
MIIGSETVDISLGRQQSLHHIEMPSIHPAHSHPRPSRSTAPRSPYCLVGVLGALEGDHQTSRIPSKGEPGVLPADDCAQVSTGSASIKIDTEANAAET